MLPGLDISSLLNLQFLSVYFLGLLIIVLFSKDKFNVPTYDKETMGPFAQLPPQSLTIDSRYRSGKFVYLFLLASLYTAICIIGPTTFNLDLSSVNLLGEPMKIGAPPTNPSNPGIWPTAAAAFLVSTGAARDNSILGRIELFIRRYAHKTAYIPNAVSDLAFSLRSLNISLWLIGNPYVEKSEFNERKAALTHLIGPAFVAKFEENPEQEGELAAWVRANILFYSLQQMFSKKPGFANARLDYLTELQENKDAFERLQRTHKNLLAQFNQQANGSLEQEYANVQGFARETSLMIAVLLSQMARNANDLMERAGALGFLDIDLRDRVDHFVYVFFVNVCIALGAIASGAILIAPPLLKVVGFGDTNWTTSDFLLGNLVIFTGLLVYLIMFKVLDYSRDRLLETQDWQESLVSYCKTALSSSIVASVICIISVVLILSLFNWLKYIVYSPASFLQLLIFQSMVAGLGAMFGLLYMKEAARLPRRRLRLVASLTSPSPFFHACLAAFLVGILNVFAYSQALSSLPQKIFDSVQSEFKALRPLMEKSSENKLWFSAVSSADLVRIDRFLSSVEVAWKKERYSDKDIASQLLALSEICGILNKIPSPTVAVTGGAEPGTANPGGELRLFAKKCEFDGPSVAAFDGGPVRDAQDQALTRSFVDFATSLGRLYDNLYALESGGTPWKAHYLAWGFPSFVAFLLAFSFGVGCRYWRAWWLYNEADRSDGQGQKLRDQIKKSYGDGVDIDKCLIFPIASLDNLTPLEALRYEDYRGKLFTKVQKRQIEWKNCAPTKEEGANAASALGEVDAARLVQAG